MARKVRQPKGPPAYERKYYGPSYNSRADGRSEYKPVVDGDGRPRPKVGVYKSGKARTVLRDPAAYDRRNKRPARS